MHLDIISCRELHTTRRRLQQPCIKWTVSICTVFCRSRRGSGARVVGCFLQGLPLAKTRPQTVAHDVKPLSVHQ